MSAPVEHPATCGDCREHHEPRVYDEKTGEWDTCSPRGTRWHLQVGPAQKACRTEYAKRPAPDEDRQEAMKL